MAIRAAFVVHIGAKFRRDYLNFHSNKTLGSLSNNVHRCRALNADVRLEDMSFSIANGSW